MLSLLLFLAACDAGTVATDKDLGISSTDTATDTDTDTDTDTAPFVCNDDNEECVPGVCRGEGSLMLPGANCLGCHARNSGEDEAPIFYIAGTAFSDLGGDSPLNHATIRVTDSDGNVTTLTSNSVGNFYSTGRVNTPLTAEIEVDGATRAMTGSVTTGACNSCHSCTGAAGGKLTGP